ncbi:restriction endonuclease subunit S [Pseudomonas sp. RW405]|uniref:restriction endonuclease subunit S n=1 Tax=Pseudomonas sp. RW405 TaxID=2202652 RepID=UPI000D72B1E5|nr:restriction endonuclease subunit S [Pseudomonas sp. RW405]PWY45279.1 restriction endonuclease subunit S [Pseudomonas sp. RW405]
MAVTAGYKQTEVGVIPDDWDVSTVGAEFEIKLGKMLDSEKNVGVPKPYLGNKSVQWGRIDLSDLPTVPMTRADLEKYRLRDGDLLVCEGGDIGRAALWNSPLEECYYQKALHRLRPLRGFDSRLMVELLRQWSDRGLLANYVTQTSIAHLPREKFMGVPMPVPPVPEQRAIAMALSDVDALLSALERLLAKKRDLKQATMQQLLTGQTRLPGFYEEWMVKRLGDVARIQRGASPRPIDSPVWFDQNSSVGWVRISDVTKSGMYLRETTQRLSPLGVQHSRPVARGSLIMSICATVGRPVITKIDVCIHDGFVVFDDLQADKLFIYYTLKWIEPDWSKHGQTGSQMNLNTGLITGTEVSLPPLPEQAAIAAVLSDMDAELAALEQRLAKTRALKQGMMQELLTGRTRLL